MKKQYIIPDFEIIEVQLNNILTTSHYNDVGNFGPGDNEDDDREGDDNWDHDWSWDEEN